MLTTNRVMLQEHLLVFQQFISRTRDAETSKKGTSATKTRRPFRPSPDASVNTHVQPS